MSRLFSKFVYGLVAGLTTISGGLLLAGLVQADGGGAVSLEVSRAEVEVGEPFEVVVSVAREMGDEGGVFSFGSGGSNRVELVGLEQFSIVGTTSSSNVQVVNGVGRSVEQTTYRLVANETGEYILGPVRAEIDGEVQESSTEKILVRDSGVVGGMVGSVDGSDGGTRLVLRASRGAMFAGLLGIVLLLAVLVWWQLSKGKTDGDATLNDRAPRESGAAHSARSTRDDLVDLESLSTNSRANPTVLGREQEFYRNVKEELVADMEEEFGHSLRDMSSRELMESVGGSLESQTDDRAKLLRICDEGIFGKLTHDRREVIRLLARITKKSVEDYD